jgi:hypothetical protein
VRQDEELDANRNFDVDRSATRLEGLRIGS